MNSVWNHAALCLAECEIAIGHCEYLMQSESPLYDTASHEAAIEAYRAALAGVGRAVAERLAMLPKPEPLVEKPCGFISESLHG